jgi:hypothetical protein
VFDGAAGINLDVSAAGLFQALQDFVFDLHVPGVVVFAGLQHGAGGRHRVAPALHLDRVEVRPIGLVIIGIELAGDEIARIE